MRLLCTLPTLGQQERVDAVAALVRSTSDAIRKRALRLGADILPDDLLVAWLRDEADDVARNAALEILKLRGGRAFALARQLAHDSDPDVVLQAALLLDHYRDPRGIAVLRVLLGYSDPNIVQAAILGLGHHRDASVINDLTPFLDADPWLQIAAAQALGDLGDPAALPVLEPLLSDEFLESFASESIAHIGGARSFRVLSTHWLRNQSSVDAERYVSLLAAVIVQLPRRARLDAGLEDAIIRQLWASSSTLRIAAATVVLASGTTSAEKTALHVLATSDDVSADLPACLSQRRDLLPLLLNDSGAPREWGLQLAAGAPRSAETRAIVAAVLRDELPKHLADACTALANSSDDDAANAIVSIFARVPPDRRRDVHPAISRHGQQILKVLTCDATLEANDQLILGALAGANAADVIFRVAKLPPAERADVVTQIFAREDVIRALPWQEWLEQDPSGAGGLLADAVMDANFVDTAPLLRQITRHVPSPRIVEALGCIGDVPSVDLLEDLLGSADGRMRAFVCNALARIGGERVRAIFHRVAPSMPPADAKFAYRAWASCAGADDLSAFRALVTHPDWLVRAATAEVLARYPDPASAVALAALALDPVEAVAQKAVAISFR